MTRRSSFARFAHHELRLAWRDWTALMSGGLRIRNRVIVMAVALFILLLHAVAVGVLASDQPLTLDNNKALLVTLSASILLSFTMMISQALESVTRAFYARDDLDLILSSPAPARHLFAVRIAAMSVTTAAMSALLVAPFVNVAALLHGPHWLAAYLLVFALAMVATGIAVGLTLAMFRMFGAKRTRLVAQIVAAVVGASFLIGIQVVAILSYGSMSRFSVLSSTDLVDAAPGPGSLVWLPAYAAMGHVGASLLIFSISAAFFAVVVSYASLRFGEHVVAALSIPQERRSQRRERKAFRQMTTQRALIHKEWMLLRRDPWLASQSLMQVLYLIPPALMLWMRYGSDTDIHVILAPVLVMATGQLAGGLAWLAISGEDAPDLVATAPVTPRALLWAKVVSVLSVVVAIAAPMVLALAFVSVVGAFVTFAGVILAATCALVIQLWFRAQAKRTNFRRRQVASRMSTFLEAFASILSAATTGLVAAGTWAAVFPGVLLAIVMLIAWLVSPREKRKRRSPRRSAPPVSAHALS
ncbi:MAG: permease [Hyphomicrobiaceae bacterium]|nr:permease [Hyphomicrobiaceae bacterium]